MMAWRRPVIEHRVPPEPRTEKPSAAESLRSITPPCLSIHRIPGARCLQWPCQPCLASPCAPGRVGGRERRRALPNLVRGCWSPHTQCQRIGVVTSPTNLVVDDIPSPASGTLRVPLPSPPLNLTSADAPDFVRRKARKCRRLGSEMPRWQRGRLVGGAGWYLCCDSHGEGRCR
jgi:hypothetical protein